MRILILAAALIAALPASAQNRVAHIRGLSSDYMRARAQLISIGYTPMRDRRDANEPDYCADRDPKTDCVARLVPEASCFVDRQACVMTWRSPRGQILRIQTGGPEHRRIDVLYWQTTRDDLVPVRSR